VLRPVDALKEMLRVGKRGIVSFPNFGHWRIRAYLMATGRMPVVRALPQAWYDSKNIHLFSVEDFIDLVHRLGFVTREAYVLVEGETRPYRENDNLWAEEALFVVTKKSGARRARKTGVK